MLKPSFFLLVVLTSLSSLFAAKMPPELDDALKTFRAEGAAHWSFVQTSESGGKTQVEHFDPSKPEFNRWTLLKKNGAAPTEAELQEYRERLSRRTTGKTAPNVKDQIDTNSYELLSEDGERANYRFRLRPGDKSDQSASHMAATFTLHKPTGTIERVEVASLEPFSPMFAVKVNEAKTVMTYSLPTAERPSLLDKITVRMRGRAMWFKSVDEEMTVTYSEHKFVGKKAPAAPQENPARANPAVP
ncbi:MAG: hypothetical protein QM790_01580 [Nibricoccus sp.]